MASQSIVCNRQLKVQITSQMFFIFASLIKADSDYCSTIYNDYGCHVCITHFIDHNCGWCSNSQTCVSYGNKTCSDNEFIYGPNSQCDKPPVPFSPTPTPSPTPSVLKGQCYLYDNENCDVCTSHYLDRNCGWCEATKKCVDVDEGKASCPVESFYYGDAGICNQPISTPMPIWPVYVGNTTFCSSLSGTWCSNCISQNPNIIIQNFNSV